MAVDRERADRRAALAALGSAALTIAQQVASKATRDALFLSSFEAEDLPRVVIASAAAAMIAVLAASRAYARFGPVRVVPFAFAASAGLYLVEWALSDTAPATVAAVLFLHTSIFGALVISGFWSVVNERFDPHTAKRVVSRIGVGATLGGVAGGVLAERLGALGQPTAMLAALAGINALAALGVRRIGGASSRPSDDGTTTWGLAVLRRTPYLRGLAGLVVLTSVSAGLLDYAFKAEAAEALDRGALLSFFALFHTAVSVLSLLVQTTLAKPALSRLGVAGSAATLPVFVLVTAGLAAVIPRLVAIVIARAGELVLANSVFRSGYELLYTPVALNEKRPTKALIDVAGNRIGDALGSALTLLVLLLVPVLAIPVVLALAAALAAAALVLARRLHRGYLGELEGTLRNGAPPGAEIDLLRAATLQTVSTLGLDREALFEQLAAHQSWSEPAAHASTELVVPEPRAIEAPEGDPVHAAVAVIKSGDATRTRALLDGELDLRLVPYVIPLLARRDVYNDAIAALRRVAERSVPALAKALLDPEQPFTIRRRLPRVLEVCESAEAADALARGLDDEKFEVRYRSALALARIAAREPARRPPVERVHAVVRAELEAGRKVWDRRRLLDEDVEDAPLLDRALRDRIHRSVEHVFTVLSLAYDAEPLRLSLIALAGDDRTLRGTALEYLENVLPEEICAARFPMLDARVEVRRKRSRQAIVDELVRSMQSMDARALQAAIDRQSGS